jgi:membrane fusion protein (multidrug efflux system)
VVRLEPELLRDVVQIPGQLEAEHSVVVKPEIGGIVESIDFTEGHGVQKGTVLVRLRDAEERARLREAEAQLALAQEEFDRTRKLASRDVSSTAQLEKATAELEVARARVEVARVELDKTLIRAPFDGELGARRVAPGDRVKPDSPLVRIDALERLQFVFTLPEVAVGIARPGIRVELRVAPFPDERFPGEVFFVSPTLDPEVRSMLVKAWVPNADRRLRPGLFANADAEIDRREGALLLPESAIVQGAQGASVWRLGAGDVPQLVPVQLGRRSQGRVEVRTGLSPGEVVVSAGTHKVLAGMAVRPIAPETAQAAVPPKAEPTPRAAGPRGGGDS